MTIKSNLIIIAATAVILSPLSATAFEVFHQDFETLSDGTHTETLWSNSRDPGACGTHCPYGGGTSTADPNPRTLGSFTDNDQNDNWGVHDGYYNKWISGNADGVIEQGYTGNTGSNMSGNVLGHRFYNYDSNEWSDYTIHDIDLAADWTNIQLMFDYDSWIQEDGDYFSVWARDEMDNYTVLTPTMDSDMQFGGNYWGFDGHESPMMGVAMFNLSVFAGETIDLVFGFDSNGYGNQEGINIDNIKITADNPPPPPPGVPEPATLGLMMLGATALYRRRKAVVAE